MFTKLLGEWCAHGEVVPGFKRYAMEHLGGEACVLGLLRGNMDARDAATVALLGGWRGGGGGGGGSGGGGQSRDGNGQGRGGEAAGGRCV